MSTIPLEDFSFFKNGSILDENGGLTIITSTLDVSPAWLVQLICSKAAGSGISTTLATFKNTRLVHLKPLKKIGLDIERETPLNFKLLDLSTNLLHLSSNDFVSKISSSLPKSDGKKSVIILEFPDILIGAGKFQANQLCQLIYKLQRSIDSCTVFVLCHNDPPLVNGVGELAEQQTDFLNQMFINSSLIVSLRAMPTGRADDITGILRITGGGKSATSPANETEYLYLVKSDTIKLFHR